MSLLSANITKQLFKNKRVSVPSFSGGRDSWSLSYQWIGAFLDIALVIHHSYVLIGSLVFMEREITNHWAIRGIEEFSDIAILIHHSYVLIGPYKDFNQINLTMLIWWTDWCRRLKLFFNQGSLISNMALRHSLFSQNFKPTHLSFFFQPDPYYAHIYDCGYMPPYFQHGINFTTNYLSLAEP